MAGTVGWVRLVSLWRRCGSESDFSGTKRTPEGMHRCEDAAGAGIWGTDHGDFRLILCQTQMGKPIHPAGERLVGVRAQRIGVVTATAAVDNEGGGNLMPIFDVLHVMV